MTVTTRMAHLNVIMQLIAVSRHADGMIMNQKGVIMMPAAPENAVKQHWEECDQADNISTHLMSFAFGECAEVDKQSSQL